MCGGPGSGKSYTRSKLIPFNGRVYDLDNLKKIYLKYSRIEDNKLILPNGKAYDISAIEPPYDMTNPKIVGLLGGSLSGIGKRLKKSILTHAHLSDEDRLPNIIFDITGDRMSALTSLVPELKEIGYNIALVYVVAPVEIAMERNKNRTRVLADKVVLRSHAGVIATFKQLVESELQNSIDDCWLIMSDPSVELEAIDLKKSGKIVIPDELKLQLDTQHQIATDKMKELEEIENQEKLAKED